MSNKNCDFCGEADSDKHPCTCFICVECSEWTLDADCSSVPESDGMHCPRCANLDTKEEGMSNKELILKALRSGEYDQTTDVLMSNDGCFCVLGVMIDLYIKQHGLDPEDSWDLVNKAGTQHLPVEVYNWAFDKDEPSDRGDIDPDFPPCQSVGVLEYGTLTELNDAEQLSFEDLAWMLDGLWDRVSAGPRLGNACTTVRLDGILKDDI